MSVMGNAFCSLYMLSSANYRSEDMSGEGLLLGICILVLVFFFPTTLVLFMLLIKLLNFHFVS